MKWKHNEPFFWAMFGAGGVVSSFVLPAIIAVIAIAVPMGWVSLDYQSMHAFADHWLGGIIIAAVISLSLWHAMHRIFHGLHDVGIHAGPATKMASYGLAAMATGLSVAFYFML
ncbi:Fumarate reductase subunit D [Sinobacterium norvegicum]|uniref:Fumarate reductase subunit D n=2 Tax=Sinobacterium norvegicum TaxID=1641715 RepID=A0ABM9AHM3_9GAMM|nr:Fumarate reductase subunit D [Sinobacterium norvegicum]